MNPILRVYDSTDGISALLLTSVFFLVMAKGLFYTRFINYMALPFNTKYVFIYSKKNVIINWFNIFFGLFQLINLALYIYFIFDVFLPSNTQEFLTQYAFILLFLLLFYLAKIAIQLINGTVFNNNKLIRELIFKKISYLNYSSFILFLANIALTYIFKKSEIVIYSSVFLVLIVNFIGWVTILKNHQKFIAAYFFYFILYLCALEIAPFVIIGSYLKD
mgnify:CR=1 FL=1